MATDTLAPDALIASIGFSSCINSDLTGIDGNWCVATDNNTNTETHNSFGTPSDPPTAGTDLQQMRCEVRLDAGSGTGTPTARIEVWEAGVLFVAGSEVNVTSSSSQIITFDWDSTSLSNSTGADVEVKVFGTKTGGSPTVRSTVDVGFVEWIADVTAAGSGRIMGSLANKGGLAGPGGIAGPAGGLAG